MLRDNLAGLIEPMRAARELNPLALFTEQKKSSDDRPQDALKIPAPKGRNLTLTENAASPFHAEPRHSQGPWRHVDKEVAAVLATILTLEWKFSCGIITSRTTEEGTARGGSNW